MNPSAVSVASQIPHWASRQLADYDARAHPGTMFAEGVVLDVGQGYELQAAGPAAPYKEVAESRTPASTQAEPPPNGLPQRPKRAFIIPIHLF